MRLHELEITAFGPFVDTVRVDFDELSSGGLFLLTGDTGSGKTSVLDAVCFALYGEVPGDRHTAKHLRSDHADPGAEPRVVLRVSVGDRTFRFTRSPSWERPKRRGTGTTRVQAHVVVEEMVGGDWRALTNRLDEAGHLVTSVLGMTCTQFTQVAMLPQGRFQAFLRATSSERQAVLQRLFRTRRFEDVERWLADRRLTLGRTSRAHHDRAAAVLNRVLEATAAVLPEQWTPDDLEPVAGDGRLADWATGLGAEASAALTVRGARLEEAAARLSEARERHQAARDRATARERGLAADRVVRRLEDSAAEEVALRDSLEAHHRAAPVLPLADQAAEATAALVAARQHAESHAAAAARLLRTFPETLEVSALDAATRVMRMERGVAESWLPRERELVDLRRRRQRVADDVEELETAATEIVARRDRLAHRREELQSAATRLRVLAARRTPDEEARQQVLAGHAAAVELEEVAARVEDARAELWEVTGRAQDLREAYQDLRESRISGMAAELAVGLAVGACCPVCGSAEHPSPAHAHDRVSRADEDAAREAWETAAFSQQAVLESVSALETRLETLAPRTSGRTPGEWAADVEEREAALAESTAAVDELAACEADLAEASEELATCTATAASTAATLDERRRQLHDLTGQVRRLETELRRLLSAHPGVTGVTELLVELDRVLGVLEAARGALGRRDQAEHDLARTTRAAEAAALEAGFDTVAGAVAAVLDVPEVAERTSRLARRESARAAALGVLGEPAVRAAMETAAVDFPPLEAAVRDAEAARDAAHAAHRQAEVRVERLETLLRELTDVLAAWEPVRRDHGVTAALASLVEGKSADNRWRMRLSAYVLSERLRQVVAAANERLGVMTDQRYTLAQVDEKGAGEQRGGLSLRVRDEWSGKERDPATLSGGETFLVSLALALGLADTVAHEAGGTQLDTLFVDEGFGALDATTLDGVMDVLDGLRDGGRVVGLVSHVAELRDRVTTRLEVRKARRGSTLTPVLVGDNQ